MRRSASWRNRRRSCADPVHRTFVGGPTEASIPQLDLLSTCRSSRRHVDRRGRRELQCARHCCRASGRGGADGPGAGTRVVHSAGVACHDALVGNIEWQRSDSAGPDGDCARGSGHRDDCASCRNDQGSLSRSGVCRDVQ